MGGFGGGGGFGQSGYGTGGGIPYQVPSLNYYLTLLTSQYQNSPNLKAFMVALLQPFIDAGVVIGQLVNAFDIDAAIGPQLDVLGLLIGASRTVSFQPASGLSPVLNDPTYRLYLKAKIAQNQWDGTATSLYRIWAQLFPGGTINIQDNQDMTAVIFLSGSFTPIIQQLITNGLIVPRPEGVLYNYVFGDLPLFGFDLDNTFIAGFDVGKWS